MKFAGVPQTRRQLISAVSGLWAEVHHILMICGGNIAVS